MRDSRIKDLEYCRENIKFKLFYVKNIKKGSMEMWNAWTVFLYRDIDKYWHAGILFVTNMYQFIV